MKIYEIYSSSFSIYQTNSVINFKPKPGPLLWQESSTGQHDSMEKSVKSITDRVYMRNKMKKITLYVSRMYSSIVNFSFYFNLVLKSPHNVSHCMHE